MVKHTQISQQQQTNCFSVIVDREVLTSLPPPPPFSKILKTQPPSSHPPTIIVFDYLWGYRLKG